MYQGWKNPQTWCIALLIDNDRDLLTKAIEAVRETEYPHACEALLRKLVGSMPGRVFDMAPWAWESGDTLDLVSFTELREHYQTKQSEGVS